MDDATLSTQHLRKYRNILNKSCMIPKFCRVGKNRICNNNIVGLCTCIQSTSLPRIIWNNNNLHFITICEAGTTLSVLMTIVPLCKHCVCHYTDASCTNHTIVNYVTPLFMNSGNRNRGFNPITFLAFGCNFLVALESLWFRQSLVAAATHKCFMVNHTQMLNRPYLIFLLFDVDKFCLKFRWFSTAAQQLLLYTAKWYSLIDLLWIANEFHSASRTHNFNILGGSKRFFLQIILNYMLQ